MHPLLRVCPPFISITLITSALSIARRSACSFKNWLNLVSDWELAVQLSLVCTGKSGADYARNFQTSPKRRIQRASIEQIDADFKTVGNVNTRRIRALHIEFCRRSPVYKMSSMTIPYVHLWHLSSFNLLASVIQSVEIYVFSSQSVCGNTRSRF